MWLWKTRPCHCAALQSSLPAAGESSRRARERWDLSPPCLSASPPWPGSASRGLCLFRSESLELTQQNLLAQPRLAVALATVLKPRPPFHPPEVAEEISALLVPHLPRSGDRSHSSAWAASLVDSAGHTDPAGHRWPVAKGGWKREIPSQVLLERTIPGAGMLGQAVGPVSDVA